MSRILNRVFRIKASQADDGKNAIIPILVLLSNIKNLISVYSRFNLQYQAHIVQNSEGDFTPQEIRIKVIVTIPGKASFLETGKNTKQYASTSFSKRKNSAFRNTQRFTRL